MAKVSDLIKEHIPSLRNEPQLVNNLDFFTSELNKIIDKVNSMSEDKRIIINFQIENKNGISTEKKG